MTKPLLASQLSMIEASEDISTMRKNAQIAFTRVSNAVASLRLSISLASQSIASQRTTLTLQ
jgi:hypothetical protein